MRKRRPSLKLTQSQLLPGHLLPLLNLPSQRALPVWPLPTPLGSSVPGLWTSDGHGFPPVLSPPTLPLGKIPSLPSGTPESSKMKGSGGSSQVHASARPEVGVQAQRPQLPNHPIKAEAHPQGQGLAGRSHDHKLASTANKTPGTHLNGNSLERQLFSQIQGLPPSPT